MKACWFDGQMIDPDEAGVSVFDHGLLYGDGVFEGIRFYDGVPFRLEAHLRRLQRSARALHLDLPYSGDDLDAATLQTALVTGEPDGYLRLVRLRRAATTTARATRKEAPETRAPVRKLAGRYAKTTRWRPGATTTQRCNPLARPMRVGTPSMRATHPG